MSPADARSMLPVPVRTATGRGRVGPLLMMPGDSVIPPAAGSARVASRLALSSAPATRRYDQESSVPSTGTALLLRSATLAKPSDRLRSKVRLPAARSVSTPASPLKRQLDRSQVELSRRSGELA